VRDNTNAVYNTIRRIGYTQRTTNYTVASGNIAGAADVFSSGITFTADGTSAYEVVFYCGSAATATNANSQVVASLVNGSGTDLGILASTAPADGTRASNATLHARTLYTPAAGSITLNVRGRFNIAAGTLNAGSGGVATVFPMYLAVYGPDLT